MLNHWNIRVYGLLIYDQQVLISNEVFRNQVLTKFPGGGLEFGEGLIDALQREFLEELDFKIDTYELFYITDYFIQSAFNKDEQLIAVYYIIHSDQMKFAISEHKIEWVKIEKDMMNKINFTFDQDKEVFEKLCLKYLE